MDYTVLYAISYVNIPQIVYITLSITIILNYILIMKSNIIRTKKIRSGLIFIAFIMSVFSVGSVYSHLSNVKALNYGDYKIVEGEIKKFSPASSNLKRIETFEIGEKIFKYSDTSLNGGLNHSLDGTIKNGSIVKVYYKNDTILKIESKNMNN